MVGTQTAPCRTCGGGLEEAFRWRDWQTVAMIQECPDCNGTGDAGGPTSPEPYR